MTTEELTLKRVVEVKKMLAEKPYEMGATYYGVPVDHFDKDELKKILVESIQNSKRQLDSCKNWASLDRELKQFKKQFQ